jgi:hypothetical protein
MKARQGQNSHFAYIDSEGRLFWYKANSTSCTSDFIVGDGCLNVY